MTTDHDPKPQGGGGAFDQLGMDARFDARMLDPSKDITDAQRERLIREINAFRDRNKMGGRPMSWEGLGRIVGVAGSTLQEVTKGTYKADDSNVLRMIDQFLAHEAIQGNRLRFHFKEIELTKRIVGAINQAIKHRAIGVVIGEAGTSKSLHAQWFAGQHSGAVLLCPTQGDSDYKWVVDALYAKLGINQIHAHRRQKLRAVADHLLRHRNTVIVVDECQKLTHCALEMLRDLQDQSDPSGERNVPIILFGDEGFYKLILQTRGGVRTPLSPQITSRMSTVFDIKVHGCMHDDKGRPIPGSVYTVEDIELIVQNARLRILDPQALALATKLANTHKHGCLRTALRAVAIAYDLTHGQRITPKDLRRALTTILGPSDADECYEQTRQFEAVALAG